MPQAQYGYTQNKFLSAKVGLEKHLLEHAFLNMSYEQIFSSNLKMAELGFRYDFSFAQTGFSVRQSDKKTTLIQYARGSLINDRKTKYLGTDNRTNVGKGGISIIPYLDLNSNGKKDPEEPKATATLLSGSLVWNPIQIVSLNSIQTALIILPGDYQNKLIVLLLIPIS
jgi:hypothetical protein